jgi:hypothetical protein
MVKSGLLLQVRVTPKSAKNLVLGVEETPEGKSHLKVRVTANPDKGKANRAIVVFLAKYFGFAKSNIQVVSGSASKFKAIGFVGTKEKLEGLVKKLQAHVDEAEYGA